MSTCRFQVKVAPRHAVQVSGGPWDGIAVQVAGGPRHSETVRIPGGPLVVYGVTEGPRGPMGPLNDGFEHVQATPASTWSVTHTLGRYPLSCEIVIADQVVFSDVEYPDQFTVVVTFAVPQAGTLRLT